MLSSNTFLFFSTRRTGSVNWFPWFSAIRQSVSMTYCSSSLFASSVIRFPVNGFTGSAISPLMASDGISAIVMKESLTVNSSPLLKSLIIINEFGYDLSRTCDEIRPGYHHVESCQETVPEAITAFLEGSDFEDVIRTAVSLGGDCDTLTCIAGSIAEAFYGVPEELRAECEARLPKDMRAILTGFHKCIRT